jgi:hypothetical protein
MDQPRTSGMGADLAVIEHLLARGEIVSGQLPSLSTWSPEKKLAAASFTGALINIRDHMHSPNRRRRREVQEDIEWIASNDTSWPHAFLRMCELFSLDADWVRARVRTWVQNPGEEKGHRFSPHRHAA